MFFKNRKIDNLVSSPLNYWEEKSYFLVIIDHDENILANITKNVSKIKNLKIVNEKFSTDDGVFILNIEYEDEPYEVGFYLNSFTIPEYYLNNSVNFSKEELVKLRDAKMALTIFMAFSNNPKKSYHLQLKIATMVVSDSLAIMDESGEKLISFRWAKMASDSKVLPSSHDLFTVQAVNHKSGEVWLHTHGLCRCHLTELEILGSNQKNFISHYNLLNTFAAFLIDKREYYFKNNYANIGLLINRCPVIATYLPWTKALKIYNKIKIGSLVDRKNGHNSDTSVVFLYKNAEDIKNNILSKVDIYNDYWGDNPIFFISDEETLRMSMLAKERFDYVKKIFNDKDVEINIKIGLLVDTKDNYEHIWFKLLEIKDDKIKLELIQDPYDVKNIHKGDIAWYNVSDITDWIIFTKNMTINPNNVYLLDIKEEL